MVTKAKWFSKTDSGKVRIILALDNSDLMNKTSNSKHDKELYHVRTHAVPNSEDLRIKPYAPTLWQFSRPRLTSRLQSIWHAQFLIHNYIF